eukprot:m.65126 g.65126  ORF g.65126 m.65126 type:complete len:221 (-) comp11515_c0_seq1:34-696(-)
MEEENPWSSSSSHSFAIGTTARLLALAAATGHVGEEELDELTTTKTSRPFRPEFSSFSCGCAHMEKSRMALELLDRKAELQTVKLKRDIEDLFSFALSNDSLKESHESVNEMSDQLTLLTSKRKRLKQFMKERRENDTINVGMNTQRRFLLLISSVAEDINLLQPKSISLSHFKGVDPQAIAHNVIEQQMDEKISEVNALLKKLKTSMASFSSRTQQSIQ